MGCNVITGPPFGLWGLHRFPRICTELLSHAFFVFLSSLSSRLGRWPLLCSMCVCVCVCVCYLVWEVRTSPFSIITRQSLFEHYDEPCHVFEGTVQGCYW